MNAYNVPILKNGLLCLAVFISSLARGQCIEEQLTFNGNQGPNIGWSIGQQFTACESSTIDEIELNLIAFAACTMKIEIYESATDWQNLIWTVDNINFDENTTMIIDLANGSGLSRDVSAGTVYSLRIWNIGTESFFPRTFFSTGDDPYTGGAALNHFGDVQNWAPNFLDFYFRISFGNFPLPVELTDFKGHLQDHTAILEWNTASETNNLGFEVERSPDGRSWENIGFVRGAGSTSEKQQYRFEDVRPLYGDNYYRLKQIDFDGQWEYSPIRIVPYGAPPSTHLSVFPNPSPGDFTVQVINPQAETSRVKLFSSTGRLLWEQRFSRGEMPVYWEKEFNLPPEEMYFVMTQVGKTVETRKVIIVRE